MTATAETGFRSEITDGVLRLTFDRPKRMNAIDLPTMTAFAAAVHDGGADPAVRTIVITGSVERSAPEPTSPQRPSTPQTRKSSWMRRRR